MRSRRGAGRRAVAVVAAGALLVACTGDDEPDEQVLDDVTGEDLEDDEDDEPDDDPVDDPSDVEDDASDGEEAPEDEAASDDEDGSDPTAAPEDVADIDEELIQAVLDDLETELGEVFALAADGAELEEVQAAFQGVYTPSMASDIADTVVEGPASDAFVDEPGRPRAEVVELRTVELGCVNAVVERDMSEVFTEPGDPTRPWSISLVPADHDDAPTAWVMAGEVLGADGDVPADDCDALLAEEDRS